MPEAARRLNRAQQRADSIQHSESEGGIYWFAPIFLSGEVIRQRKSKILPPSWPDLAGR